MSYIYIYINDVFEVLWRFEYSIDFVLCRVVEPKENFGKAESPSKRDNMSFDRISESAKYLKEKIKLRPKIGVICGTGLGK